MNISDLQSKNIIDLNTGKNLGKIIDLVIDESGKVIDLVLEKKKFFFNVTNKSSTTIKWNNISKIGEDVILINFIDNTN